MQEGVAGRDLGELGVQREHPAGWGRTEARPSPQRVGHGHGSAQLEARGALDGVEELAPQQRLVLELGELQQVHAGAGCGQPLQVGAPVVDAERGVQLLQDSGRTAVTRHGLQGAFQTRQTQRLFSPVPTGTPALSLPSNLLQISTQYCVWASGIKKDREQCEHMGHRVLLVERPLKLLFFCLLKISLKF